MVLIEMTGVVLTCPHRECHFESPLSDEKYSKDIYVQQFVYQFLLQEDLSKTTHHRGFDRNDRCSINLPPQRMSFRITFLGDEKYSNSIYV